MLGLLSPSVRGCALALGLMVLTAPSAQADEDICERVADLCAADHLANLDDLREAVGPEAAALLDTHLDAVERLRDVLAAQELDIAAMADSLRDTNLARNTDLLPDALQPDEQTAAVDPRVAGRFGQNGQGETLEEAFAGTQDRLGANRSRNSGSPAGAARDALIGTGLPSRDGWTANDREVVTDFSSMNDNGGVTRVEIRRDGSMRVTSTGEGSNGSSYRSVDVIDSNGHESHEITVVGGRHQGDYVHVVRAERDSPTDFFTITEAESFDRGANWQVNGGHQDVSYLRGMAEYPPHLRRARNVDPDAVGPSSQPPVCAFANPDCAMPLIIRFHETRPDRRGRPDESTPIQAAPRLRPDLYGTVVNPGPIERPTPGQAPPATGARSYDGGALVNPGGDPDG